MAKFVLAFICLVAIIETSWALKCKSCKDASCSSLEDVTCPASPSNQEAACLIHIYKDDANAKEEIVEKKCVNRSKDGKFDCIKHKSSEVEVKCETCTTDFCNEKNGASQVTFSSLTVCSIIVALFAPKFL